jgi:hypothetical protein
MSALGNDRLMAVLDNGAGVDRARGGSGIRAVTIAPRDAPPGRGFMRSAEPDH